MKVLVLENVSGLDLEINRYLHHEHSNDEVDIIYRLQKVDKAVLHEKLLWADCICTQTTFYDRDQLKAFVKMLASYKNIKEFRIIFSYTSSEKPNALLQLLNFETKEYYNEIKQLIETRKVSEIVCRTVILKESEFFNKQDVQYYIVPLYVNYDKFPSLGMIWHKRQPCPDKQAAQLYKKPSGLTIQIEQKDVPAFREMINELKATIEYQKESCELQDFGDSKKLIAEKNVWLDLINKYKLNALSKIKV